MGFIKNIKTDLAKENPFISVVEEGIISDVEEYTDTGSYMLNALLSGDVFLGLPHKKITVLAGETTVGKTYLCFSILKNFLNQDPKNEVIYLESEGALTAKMFKERNIDDSRVLVVPVQTVQEFRKYSLQILDKYIQTPDDKKGKILLILDSLGNLSTTKEMEDSLEGKETVDMTRSKIIKSAFRTITLKLSVADVPMLITNHVYDEQGLFPRKIMSGGSGIHYNSAVTIFLSKKKEKDSSGQIVGNILTAKVIKSRFIKENVSGQLYLDYIWGLSKYYGLLDFAESVGLITKTGRKYEIYGQKYSLKEIYNDPDSVFTETFLNDLNSIIKKKFCFGSTLGIENVNLDEYKDEDENEE